MLFKVLQVHAKSTVAFLCLFLFSATFMVAQNCNSTLAHWNLDACSPDDSYDEFTAQLSFPDNLSGSASILSNSANHSCTPGSTGVGMCHSIHDDCTYEADNQNAFRFSVTVNPDAGFKATISGLNFFEAAPLNFTWLNGATGDNDPPSLYGIRVLRNGNEIFRQIELATTPTYSLEEFDFSGNMDFMTDESAIFTFEILGYCRQANSPVGFAVWDIDEISVIGCVTPACDADGGTLTGGPFNFCVDGVADNIPAGGINVSGGSGTNRGWIVTDDAGNILGLPPSFTAPDFDAAGVGVCFVYYIAYESGLMGLTGGANIDDLQGCFDLSNGIQVTREVCPSGQTCPTANGGTLTGGPFNFCVDGTPDNIPANGISLAGGFGANSGWVVTDDIGNILGLPPSFTAPDFDAAGVGVCFVYYISYDNGLVGLTGGGNINNLTGCFDLSNGVQVTREICNNPPPPPSNCPTANGGTLTGGPFNFCVDGVADNIPANGISLSGGFGDNRGWVVTDDVGNILGLPPSFTAPDFDAAGVGVCFVYYIAYDNGLAGLTGGGNINNLQGCFDLSNGVQVTREICNNPPPPNTPGCDAVITVNGNTVSVAGANDALNSITVFDVNGGVLFQIDDFSGTALPGVVTYTFPADGRYFVHVQTYTAGFGSKVCDVFETIIIGNPPPDPFDCVINATASNVRCDGAGTFSFDVTASTTNGGAWGFDVLGTNVMTAPNGSTATVTGVPVGNGATLTFTVIDHDKPSCTTTITVTPPTTPCSMLPPPSNSDVCEASVNVSGRTVNIDGLTNAFTGVRVVDNDFRILFQCDSWDGNCEGTFVDYTFEQEGSYYVSIVTYDAEWDEICRIFEKVEINDRDGLAAPSAEVSVFPNPAETNVSLKMNGFNKGDINVLVLSQFGKVVKTFKFNDVDDLSNVQLQLEGLNNGVYSVIVLSENNDPVSTKLVVGKLYNSSLQTY